MGSKLDLLLLAMVGTLGLYPPGWTSMDMRVNLVVFPDLESLGHLLLVFLPLFRDLGTGVFPVWSRAI